MRFLRILTISFLRFSSLKASFYERAMEGRYWYDEKDPKKEEEQPHITEDNAIEELHNLRQKVDKAKALAVLVPSRVNVKHYMLLQQQLVKQSELFAKAWEKILLEDATLSGQLTNPTSQYAVNARKALQYQEINALLEKSKSKHILLFIYDSRETFSQIAGEMMTAFIEDTGWEVIAVSVDQGNLPQFPDSKIAADQGKALGIEATPSYVVINKQTEQVIHVGFGALSVSQLKENIYVQLKESL